jgi:hypothetical protein
MGLRNKNTFKSGEEHRLWKGESASKVAFHQYLRKTKPKSSICQLCLGNTCGNKQPFELVNLKDHKYTRDPLDYRWASRKCHNLFDGPWNKGKKGLQVAWNKGRKGDIASDYTKKKMSNSQKRRWKNYRLRSSCS